MKKKYRNNIQNIEVFDLSVKPSQYIFDIITFFLLSLPENIQNEIKINTAIKGNSRIGISTT